MSEHADPAYSEEADLPHPFHMSSYGAEPRCWCGRYFASTVHIPASESEPE